MAEKTENDNVIPLKSRESRRGGEFVPTNTARRILDSLGYAMREEDLAVIYGEPGVGKTRTIQHFREQLEEQKSAHVWVVTISPSISTVVPMLTSIANAVGVVTHESGARRLHDAISAKLASARSAILIVDEAQHLRKPALEELRAIHDSSERAVALVGNEEVYRRLAQHPQLHSRVGVRLKLSRPKEEDVRRYVVTRWAVNGFKLDEEAFHLLDQISQLPGAMRLVTKVMKAADKERTAKGVRTACKMLGVDLGGVSQ